MRFDAYMVATTIEEAKEKGMTTADLKHDFNQGFCWFDEESKKSNGPQKQTHPRIPNVMKSSKLFAYTIYYITRNYIHTHTITEPNSPMEQNSTSPTS